MKSGVETYYSDYWTEGGHRPSGSIEPLEAEILSGFLDRRQAGSLFDFGCGDASRLGPWAKARGWEYSGADVSDTAVRAATDRGFSVSHVADGERLPLDDNSFDVVVSLEVLEHLFQPQLAASELFRVLRPGGLAVFSVPNVAYWRHRLDFFCAGRWNPNGDRLSLQQPWRDPHIRFFTVSSLRQMLSRVGFQDVTVRGAFGRLVGSLPLANRLVRPGTTASAPYRLLEKLYPQLFGARLFAVAFK